MSDQLQVDAQKAAGWIKTHTAWGLALAPDIRDE